MKLRLVAPWLAFTASLAVSLAAPGHAQDGSPQWDDMPMASEGSDPRLEKRMSQMGSPKDPTRHTRGPVGTLYVGVPIANSVDRDVVRPGGSIDFRGGYDLGWVVPEFEAGFMGLPIRSGSGSSPLKQFYFGLGARLQIPNSTMVLPYLSGAFDFQFWNLYETQLVCDYWYCWEQNYYRFTPGFTGRTGVALRIHSRMAFDLGVRVGMSFKGDVFDEARSWVQPSVGFTVWN